MGFDTVTIAFIFAILGFGVFISFRILNITDLTVEASFGLGAAISGMMCRADMVEAFGGASWMLPVLAIICSFVGGAFAGLITALLHTKLKINSVLSGILTLTAFYTINLLVVDIVNTSIGLKAKGITMFPANDVAKFFIMFGIVLVVATLIACFFRTKLGLSIRACGDNEQMTKTQCISTDLMKIIGLALSNALVALAGCLFVQFQGSFFTQIEKGMMVVGVTTIIIGEIISYKKHNIEFMLVGIIVGSIIYRFVYALVLQMGVNTVYLQMITAILLVIILASSAIKETQKRNRLIKKNAEEITELEKGGNNNA